ncbi:Hypothetical protein FKW44_019661 [Caligus rogercresseyi]|uniref:Uncharacterized protein n=1 Tax=Caligus rogercresseyi TaxID=217165 RepID=A0A7T8JXJ6_CALRO|nr:Hypothetical protein FKW44_019661 [Caligus rogercresseyi]
MAKASSDVQLAINDFARVLLDVRRADRLHVADLSTVHIFHPKRHIVKQASISARKAMNVDSCPLERTQESFDENILVFR